MQVRYRDSTNIISYALFAEAETGLCIGSICSMLLEGWWNFRQPLQWRYNGRDGVSNQQPSDCLLSIVMSDIWYEPDFELTKYTPKITHKSTKLAVSFTTTSMSSYTILLWTNHSQWNTFENKKCWN